VPRPDAPILAWLGAVDGDTRLVGGKAASLDALARLGFRIPPGFCLTTRAFDAQLAALPSAVAALARLPDEAARAQLTAEFETAALAPEVAAALAEAVARLTANLEVLGATPVRFAVRSSGIGEDSSAASFAGLHETELGVAPDGVADSVRRCWASLWSPAAMAYRQRKGLALDGGGMAVVVQALVPADAAAVVFTRHPVTGRTDQLVITGVRGLGDAMVSGTVTPDTWVIDRATGTTVDYTPGDRAAGQAGAALESPLLGDLTRLALSVEAGFGAPVDIEAAASRGAWFLLQARPITT
jgi:phosphoenolpyruvate synthase/pyruvate phosphate dikinase